MSAYPLIRQLLISSLPAESSSFFRVHELFSSDGIEETPKEHVHGIINIAFCSKVVATHGVTMGLRAGHGPCVDIA